MKAILEFNHDDPEARIELLRCTKSLDMACALLDIKNFLRNAVKYIDGDIEHYEEMRGQVNAILNNYNLDLDELL